MKPITAAILAIALLPSCSTSGQSATPWLECAKAEAIGLMEVGIPSSWPSTNSLPEGLAVQIASLGTHPPGVVHDAFYRTLHLVQSENAFYLQQTGGIAGIDRLYGPIPLSGRCMHRR
ncbi:hypothetical protein [Lysobacter sp. A3-1-A15]|uniref:hypothetical protein n=1 Tax=Novilysobacter viscosus TaxID=3098602 RepID=UPI002EDB6F59